MTGITSQQLEAYIPQYDVIPEKWEDARAYLTEQLKKIADAINAREIGWYLDEELLSGKNLLPGTSSPTDQTFRAVFRTVVVFGALPNATTKSVVHNITFDVNFSLVHLYAAATDPVDLLAFEIGLSSSTLNQNIKLTLDDTYVYITTSIDYSSYTRCYVVIEYTQEQ